MFQSQMEKIEKFIRWQETSPCHPDPGMSPPTACRAAVPSVEILAVEEVLR